MDDAIVQMSACVNSLTLLPSFFCLWVAGWYIKAECKDQRARRPGVSAVWRQRTIGPCVNFLLRKSKTREHVDSACRTVNTITNRTNLTNEPYSIQRQHWCTFDIQKAKHHLFFSSPKASLLKKHLTPNQAVVQHCIPVESRESFVTQDWVHQVGTTPPRTEGCG